MKTSILTAFFLTIFSLSLVNAEEVHFSLPNETGEMVTFSGEGISVLEWTNPGCPFVKKFYKSGFMQKIQEKYVKQGVTWITVNSTNDSHRDYIAPENRVKEKERQNSKASHFLFDSDGVVGQALGAKTTPHLFVLQGKNIVYKGAIDDAADTDSDPSLAKNYVMDVLDRLLKGENVEATKNRPYGCSVKY